MGTSAFKDLVIDANDAGRAAEFWAAALGLEASPHRPGVWMLSDGVDEHTVWIDQVPEPRTVKQRVHLDVFVGAVEELIGIGATVDNEQPGWTVLRDPEGGGELCAFVRPADQLARYRLYEVIVDCADSAAISRWWADRFGLEVQQGGTPTEYAIEGGSLPWPMVFDVVPEPKTAKNRIHWDVWGDTEDFVAAGATVLRSQVGKLGWDVLADPEGNEFCVFSR